jgi:methionyl-tRNA synthetase
MLSPVMPSKTKDILDILGTNDFELSWGRLKSGSKISVSEPIFPRIS